MRSIGKGARSTEVQNGYPPQVTRQVTGKRRVSSGQKGEAVSLLDQRKDQRRVRKQRIRIGLVSPGLPNV